MSISRKRFVDGGQEIVDAKPEYDLGCSDRKKCDCIGMIKYSLRQGGVKLETTGTNWTFRNQVEDARKITGVSSLKYGDVVFKAREPGDDGYNLPAKYRKGGSAYNGDLNDYCHIGIVKSVSPVRIIHMTSPTAKEDTKIGKWKYAAAMRKQYVDNVPDPEPDPVPEPGPYVDEAIVTAQSGRYVKMRREPSTKCRMYDEVPIGAKVKVLVHGYEWTKISYGRRTGWYMMTRYLDTVGDGEGEW